jgi:hypothetical protein
MRQIKLTLADLRPCQSNLFGQPDSWYDLFRSVEAVEPPNIAEWNAARLKLIAEREQRAEARRRAFARARRRTPPASGKPGGAARRRAAAGAPSPASAGGQDPTSRTACRCN